MPDWGDRLKAGQTIIPAPIYPEEATRALEIFKELRIPDLAGKPKFGDVSEQWVFDFVAAIFGAYDSKTGQQKINEFMLLVSKKNTKSTLAAGVMLTALILCWREEEEHLIIAPTKEIADASYKPAAAMIRADEELSAIFHVQEHIRTITHRIDRNSLKVVAADTDTVAGKKAGRILIDELWVFGSRAKADGMIMEATGGLVSRPEGFIIYLTTQADEAPAGVFKERLDYARDVRDGNVIDSKFLPVLYEFPKDMLESKAYLLPENFHITNPNLGRSVSKEWIEDKLKQQMNGNDGSYQKFIAKHLNVEIGLNLRNDRWAGADFWEQCAGSVSLDELVARSEVVVVGIDGGGLDDLLGFCAAGREAETGKWLYFHHAWAHEIVLERRKDISDRLQDFVKDGKLTIVKQPGDDVIHLCQMVATIGELLPEKHAVGVDAAGIGSIVEELTSEEFGISMDQIIAIGQGWKLNGAIKTLERKLAGGQIEHDGSAMMNWCVGNARVVPVGNAIRIDKQVSGSAKIDPLMAALNATQLLMLNPESSKKKYQMFFL